MNRILHEPKRSPRSDDPPETRLRLLPAMTLLFAAISFAPLVGSHASQLVINPEQEGLISSIFSGTSLLIVLILGGIALFVCRKSRSRRSALRVVKEEGSAETQGEGWEEVEQETEADYLAENESPAKANDAGRGNSASPDRTSMARLPVTTPASLYGAYRVDQEVGKLVLGQAHRMDVLSSRAPDDRRAIEASLLKTIAAADAGEDAKSRAREALEEYGFVARQCAAMLLAPEAFDRTAAARVLGEVKSPAALPFLLEALYDQESAVRNQAVLSIGELKTPSAIGALLDMARRHPEVPGGLLSRSLSACSVEGLDFFDSAISETGPGGVHDITHLEPLSQVEELPGTLDDQVLATALSQVESENIEQRSGAIKSLGEFRTQNAVNALVGIARSGLEPGIRASAIASLATIGHESVFPAVLIGMADESREVRAAAARALSRLNFDRADAYVRVMETADAETLRNVALACIQAGIVSQGIDRLTSSDRRQAYEAFSLISLLARADMAEPVYEAVGNHPSLDVRLCAVRLLATTGERKVFERLREVTIQDGIAEEVKTALFEALYKMEQSRQSQEEQSSRPNYPDLRSEFAGENIAPPFYSEADSTHEMQSSSSETEADKLES